MEWISTKDKLLDRQPKQRFDKLFLENEYSILSFSRFRASNV